MIIIVIIIIIIGFSWNQYYNIILSIIDDQIDVGGTVESNSYDKIEFIQKTEKNWTEHKKYNETVTNLSQ